MSLYANPPDRLSIVPAHIPGRHVSSRCGRPLNGCCRDTQLVAFRLRPLE